MEKRISLSDGFVKQNMVFMTGMLIAPIIACVTTLTKSFIICFVFSIVTYASIMLCRLIPRTIVYTLRVIMYCLAASVFYIPATYVANALFGAENVMSVGVYLPIMVTNSLILTKTETRFFLEPVGDMAVDVICFITGFDGACILTGLLREFLSSGKIAGVQINVPFTIPALETTFGGFIFAGICAGIFRALYERSRRAAVPQQEESLAEYAEDVGEFLVGKKSKDKEKIRIYRASAKKAKNENELLEMEFLSNRDVLEAFESIVAQGAGDTQDTQQPETAEAADNNEEALPESADDEQTAHTEEQEMQEVQEKEEETEEKTYADIS